MPRSHLASWVNPQCVDISPGKVLQTLDSAQLGSATPTKLAPWLRPQNPLRATGAKQIQHGTMQIRGFWSVKRLSRESSWLGLGRRINRRGARRWGLRPGAESIDVGRNGREMRRGVLFALMLDKQRRMLRATRLRGSSFVSKAPA